MRIWYCTFIVAIHLVISILHGAAHTRLGVALNTWQTIYVAVVITAVPILAAILLWTRHSRLGFRILAGSMAASFVFGVSYHFIAISTDHVLHLPPGDAQGLFRVTAVLLAATEVLGLILGIWGIRNSKVDHHRGTESQRS